MKYYIITFLLLIGQSCYSQIIPIPDTQFLSVLISLGVDQNDDGQISQTEANAVDSLKIRTFFDDLKSVQGIEYFNNLRHLDIHDNEIESLNISSLSKLEILICSRNELTQLDCSQNHNLQVLRCERNDLQSLTINNGGSLVEIDCSANSDIKHLDFSDCLDLQSIDCSWTDIETIDLSNCVELRSFRMQRNPAPESGYLKALDVSDCVNLEYIHCFNSEIEHLDLSNNPNLKYLHSTYNPLTTIDLSKVFEC